MPKTYTAAGSATAGQVYTSSAHNVIVTDVNNLIVPPVCEIVRTTNLSYTTGTDITFQSATIDTDGMFSAGTPTRLTIQTTGIYLISFVGALSATATMTAYSPHILRSTTSLAYQDFTAVSSTNVYWWMSCMVSCTAGEYFTARLNITGGSSYSMRGQTTTQDSQTRLSATWIGRTS
jgi:hypothetical protein